MSDAPVLRRSSRRRAPPRNPDSPVSHAPLPAQNRDDSSSDEEDASVIGMVQDLQAGIESEARQRTSDAFEAMAPESRIVRDTGHENIAADSLLAAQLQTNAGDDSDSGTESMPDLQTPSDEEGDDDGDPLLLDSDYTRGSLQEQADRIISDIVLFQGRNPTDVLSFLTSASTAGVPSRSSPSRQIVATAPSERHEYTLANPDRTSEELYFVGIHSLAGAHSFCEIRAFSDPNPHDGALVSRLQRSGGPLGRALATVTDRASFYIGVSDYPIDVAHNYSNWLFRFREIGVLLELEQSHSHEPVFSPITLSARRTALLTRLSLPHDMPVSRTPTRSTRSMYKLPPSSAYGAN
ncbi:hypothetical protein FB45DRAFT_1019181 [Roridomyces roridus]|uniref:Uncharacterized protein n=1 Tax=Roridomyces roridus TaxID=1738132 RepID=A0AAD7FYS3_9AGAR|nr:hypothetical protein FB45DRAFT_1019181 [Roridomyces roridus]